NPANVVRGQGETSIIADIIKRSTRDLRADPKRVYLTGHSAGGGIVSDVSALYPELFAAISVSAGFPYLADPTGTALRAARRGRPVPTYVIHGDADSVAPFLLGQSSASAARIATGLPITAPARTTIVPASATDRYRTVVRSYGSGQREVRFAEVNGADHPSGPGGLTVNGPNLDRQVIDFLLSKRRG
ncbi:MAG: PHB depolymerase family esterase, partial [Gordonia sp. (in: high G+C Gram-positive bacteria)]